LFGGGGHRVGEGGDTTKHTAELRAWAEEHFPVEAVHAEWSAHDILTADSVPFVGRVAGTAPGGLFVATGFRKWGFTNAGAAALAITGLLRDEPPPWWQLFDPKRLRVSPRAFAAGLHDNATVARHFVGDRLSSGRPPRCTHMGCVPAWNESAGTWDCPCHGSRFEPDGDVVAGPAILPLHAVSDREAGVEPS
jgi:hypothetical protein